MKTNKSILLRWSGVFFLGNAVLLWIIGLNYLRAISWIEPLKIIYGIKGKLVFFTAVTYLGQLALFAFIPYLFIVLLILIYPNKNLIISIAVLLATTVALWLVIDSFTFGLYHFHVNGVIFHLILNAFHQSIFDFSNLEILLSAFALFIPLVVEIFYARWLWQKRHKLGETVGRYFALFLGLSFYISYSMVLINANRIEGRFLLDTARVLPFYTDVFGGILPVKYGKYRIEHLGEYFPAQMPSVTAPVAYPAHPLLCNEKLKNLNVVMIVIDTWRFDALNSAVTPNITKFADKSWQFTKHFSGGNATGPGIFTLLYAIPSTYWTAMQSQHQGPVLIKEFLHRNYQTGIYSSANIFAPAFNHTVFQDIPNLEVMQQPGPTPFERDQAVTTKFLNFLKSKTDKPFFSFLFYDSAHAYCSLTNNFSPFVPAVHICDRLRLIKQPDPLPYLNRYRNALLLVDAEIKKVITALEDQKLLENTVIVITGDHGEEFNDNGQGYWHHASNFTHFQVQTPLIVYWPGKAPGIFTHQTSHFDIAPTLLNQLWTCKNPSRDVSVGMSLFDNRERSYLITGSYIDFAIVDKHKITTIFSSGGYEVENLNAKPMPSATLDVTAMRNAFDDLKRFYKE